MKPARIASFCLVIAMLAAFLVSCGDSPQKLPDDTTTAAATATKTAATQDTTAPSSENTESEGETTMEPVNETDPTRELFYTDNFAKGAISEHVSPAVMALLSCCEYYVDTMKKSTAEGKKWVYSNSSTYVPQTGYFDDMVKSGKCGANCTFPANWSLRDMGVMPASLKFYCDKDGNFVGYNSVIRYLEPVCEITDLRSENVTFKDLYEAGKVKPGDIFLANPQHTFIYRGDQTFYATGHDAKWHSDPTAPTEDPQKAVFEEWIMPMATNKNYNYRISYVIRLKDDFIPQFYRNAEGKLVENPMYDPATSLVFKPSDYLCYDTNGRDNILAGAFFNVSNGFNLKKFSPAGNITDDQIYYDNTTLTYTDIQFNGGNEYALNPTYWFDANGNRSEVKDETHKYLCGFWTQLDKTYKVDSFALYTQNVGATSGTRIGDIDGFDILVSTDGYNWTVVYSIERASAEDKWSYITDEKNLSPQGVIMTHYILADFTTGPVEASYVMFALTCGRTQDVAGAEKYGHSIAATSATYFRVAEFQVYRVEEFSIS